MVSIADIMTRQVASVEKNSSILEASRSMSTKGISCIIVHEGDKPVGILTRRDILEKVVAKELDAKTSKVGECMSSPLVTIPEAASIVAASGVMNARQIKQLPVEKDGSVTGIVTQTDIVRNINRILKFDVKNEEYKL